MGRARVAILFVAKIRLKVSLGVGLALFGLFASHQRILLLDTWA